MALLVVTVALCTPRPALAIEDRADIEPNTPVSAEHAIAWKLTAGAYRETAGQSALDVNLRGNRDRKSVV